MRRGTHKAGRVRHSLCHAALAVAIAASLPVLDAAAQSAPVRSEATVRFDIPTGDLAAALDKFSTQSGLQVVYRPELIQGKRSRAVSGALQPSVALARLLEGTEVVFERVNDATFALRAVLAAPKPASAPTGTATPAQENVVELETMIVRGYSEMLTGSASLNADIPRHEDDIQPYIVINRDAIRRSGAADMAELLRKNLPANSSALNSSVSPGQTGNTSNINLRGLGSHQTLILIDGRRAGAYSFSGDAIQADLNSIPLSAIDRIEVLPMSASGIHGGGATGGVVNVVLRRDHQGVDVALAHDNTFHSDSTKNRIDVSAGIALNEGRTNILFSGSYADSNPLLVKDRDLFESGRATLIQNNPSLFFGPNASPPLGATTNIRSNAPPVNGVRPPLTLRSGITLNSPIAYVPYGYAGITSDGGNAFLGTAGEFNWDLANTGQANGGGNRSLSIGKVVKSGRFTLRHELSSSISAFMELSASDNTSAFPTNNTTATFTVSRFAPNNPFDQDVRVTTPAIGADSVNESRLENRKGLVGAIFQLPWKEWQLSLDHTWEQTELSSSQTSAGISAAGTAAIMNGSLDVFRDTNLFPVDFLQYRAGDTLISPISTTLNDSAFRLGGGLLSIPGGDVDIQLLLERNSQRIGDFSQVSTNPAQTVDTRYPRRMRVVNSAYAELRVPIISAKNEMRGFRLLEFQLAGRFDKYTSESTNVISIINGVPNATEVSVKNSFSSTVPTVGVRFSPLPSVMLRASYSEGFLPPPLTSLVPTPDAIVPGGFPTLLDPRRDNTPVAGPVTLLTGGNPELLPETSRSRSIGFVITPSFVPGLRLSWDWATIDKEDNIGSFIPLLFGPAGLQALLQNESYIPGLVTRAPAQNDGFDVGPITVLNTRALNFARSRVQEYDWSVDYTLSTERSGEFYFEGSATQRIHNQLKTTPALDFVEGVELVSLPRWSANAELTWQYRGATLTWAAQYLDSYFYQDDHGINQNQGAAEAPSATYHDFSFGYNFRDAGRAPRFPWLSNVEIQLGVKNIFNTRPRLQVELGTSSFDSRVDPRLATYYLILKKSL